MARPQVVIENPILNGPFVEVTDPWEAAGMIESVAQRGGSS
jgi:hypothetical protein